MPLNRRQNRAGGDVELYHNAANQLNHGHPGNHILNGIAYCCVPSGCNKLKSHPIIVAQPQDAVKVICNNDSCTHGEWMHGDCFAEWQEQIMTQLRSCSRARQWSEKQRRQNLWTKKGYDLIFRACECLCSRGTLKKNLDYFPPVSSNKIGKKKSKRHDKQLPALQKVSTGSNHTTNNRHQLRVRTASISSTGSSPPSSAGTPPSSSSLSKVSNFSLFADVEQAAAGNIFKRRIDLAAFNMLPKAEQNSYRIQMADEGPHGNDDIRCSVLSNLSTKKVTSLPCVLCGTKLTVYDRYPLIDGTLFLSPQPSNIAMQTERRTMYMHATCITCLLGVNQIQCITCNTPWTAGRRLILGSMYSYDIFAASPCCSNRLKCKRCDKQLLDPSSPKDYSFYSRDIECPHCFNVDTHFVKPLSRCISIYTKSICK